MIPECKLDMICCHPYYLLQISLKTMWLPIQTLQNCELPRLKKPAGLLKSWLSAGFSATTLMVMVSFVLIWWIVVTESDRVLQSTTITYLTAHPLSRKWTVTFSIGPNGRNRLQTSSSVVLSDIFPMYTIRLSSYN